MIPLLIIYAALQGLRVGLATAHASVDTTIGLDLGAFALVLGIVAISRAARRRGIRRRTGVPAPPLGTAARRAGYVGMAVGFAAVTVISSLASRNLVATHSRSIGGAPGYTTYGGPHGYPLAVGSPWGRRCQPIRFSVSSDVSDSDYYQIAAVVQSARSQGVDVTIESRSFMWDPNQLYPPGLSNATVERIGIFVTDATPPRLSNGHLERINFGWDASVSSDGHHEYLTDLQATLYLSQIEAQPQWLRIAIRQFIAFSQGVGGSTAAGSGISRGSTVDGFTPDDLNAMSLMSGCNFSAAPPA